MRVLHPSAYPNAKNPFPLSTRKDKAGLEPGIARLVADGEAVLRVFEPAFKFLADKCNVSAVPVMNPHKRAWQAATSVGPLKKSDRIEEKSLNDYKEEKYPFAAVCDVVRATMAFNDPGGMLGALEKLVGWDGLNVFGSGAVRYRIAKAKELYSLNFQSLYGDVKLSLLFYLDGVPDGHVCELQLNTVPLIAAKGSEMGHLAYEVERTLENKWNDEHPKVALPSLVQIEEHLARLKANASDPEVPKYGGQSAGMKGATVDDYFDLYRPLVDIMQKCNAPARQAFDGHPASSRLIERVRALTTAVDARWKERFVNFGMWAQLDQTA